MGQSDLACVLSPLQLRWRPRVEVALLVRVGSTFRTRSTTHTAGVVGLGRADRLLPHPLPCHPNQTLTCLPAANPSVWPWATPVSSLLMSCKQKVCHISTHVGRLVSIIIDTEYSKYAIVQSMKVKIRWYLQILFLEKLIYLKFGQLNWKKKSYPLPTSDFTLGVNATPSCG